MLISHELRSPLAAIRYAAVLLDRPSAGVVARHKARMCIERQVAQMTRLLDDFLEVARIGSGRLHLKRERLDLRDLVRHAIETVESNLDERKHRLTVALPDAPVWLYAEPGRLERVLVNLLVNAAKFTDVGGAVGVSLRQENDQAVVRVWDCGIGIVPDMLPHVFDLFMQADPTAQHSEAGLGIGLALVRSFVELHGGRVSAASAGLGKGSEFTVHLPLEKNLMKPDFMQDERKKQRTVVRTQCVAGEAEIT